MLCGKPGHSGVATVRRLWFSVQLTLIFGKKLKLIGKLKEWLRAALLFFAHINQPLTFPSLRHHYRHVTHISMHACVCVNLF